MAEHGPAFLADEPADSGGEDRAYVSYLPIGTILAVCREILTFGR